MSDKYNYHEFKKIVKDFVGDILVTFPEQIDNLDKRLLLIHNSINTNNTTEYSNNYDETSKDNDDDEDQELEETGEQDSDKMLNTVQEIFEYCYEIYPERFFDILYQNVEMFENEDLNTYFLPGIDFKILWKENISDNTRNNIWKYLQLILFTIITNVENKNTFGETAKLFEAINEDEFKEKLEDTIKGFENIFDLSNDTFNQDLSKNLFENMPDPKEIHDHISGIMNGKLGELAKELAEETAKDFDLTEENIKDPKDIFKTLFKNPQKLMNLVKNVGTKLDEKMKSGDIKESELLEEASSMFNNMKGMPGMENSNMKDLFNNLNIGEMMKNMGMMPPGGKFNQNAFNSKMEENLKASRAKDRMRTKLDANRKNQEENKNRQENKTTTENNTVKNDIQNNLDFLFNNDNSNLTKLNTDLQKLEDEMKQKNNETLNTPAQNTNKKKKKGKKR